MESVADRQSFAAVWWAQSRRLSLCSFKSKPKTELWKMTSDLLLTAFGKAPHWRLAPWKQCPCFPKRALVKGWQRYASWTDVRSWFVSMASSPTAELSRSTTWSWCRWDSTARLWLPCPLPVALLHWKPWTPTLINSRYWQLRKLCCCTVPRVLVQRLQSASQPSSYAASFMICWSRGHIWQCNSRQIMQGSLWKQ